MPDLQKLQVNKDKILSTLKFKGPSFPTRIARETGISSLFVAALLAELASERKVKLSNMKVGSSPLYYLQHQNSELENFVEHLNNRERDAFLDLKESKILDDEKQTPATRVALRKIKDFAIPVQVRINGELKLFWRYFQIPEDQTKELIQNLLSPQDTPKQEAKEEKPIEKEEVSSSQSSDSPQPSEKSEEKNETNSKETAPIEEPKSETKEEKFESPLRSPQRVDEERGSSSKSETKINNPPKEEKTIQHKTTQQTIDSQIKTEKPKKAQPQHEFPEKIKSHLEENNISILKEISQKKKEFIAKVSSETKFGKQEFYMIAKEKKKVNQNDLTIALQNAQTEKMPALFLSPGALDKKAEAHLEEWRNLIKFKQID